MNWIDLKNRFLPAKDWIIHNQLIDGSIPWDEKGKCDSWDHSECLIALAIYEEWDAFDRGVEWFFSNLNSEGLIYSEFSKQKPTQLNYQSHHAPYIALPLLQRYLIDQKSENLDKYLPQLTTIFSSLLSFMDEDGMYHWSKDNDGYSDNSLITASMSIAISVQAYSAIIKILKIDSEDSHYEKDFKLGLLEDLKNLLDKSFWANSEIPWARFDRDGIDRSRFSMDFFYQSLARVNLDKDFFKLGLEHFYVQNLGIKCVEEEPWVTMAESSECIIATFLNYDKSLAIKMFDDILKFQNKDGIFPTGYQYKLDILWPNEQSTWTNAALIIAGNVICGNGNNIFTFLANKP
jgi:hypothetical protein|tara:strand:- start:5196 stop:6239 length:1044 start_codon:yes stop_codon:yes gene_type:complete